MSWRSCVQSGLPRSLQILAGFRAAPLCGDEPVKCSCSFEVYILTHIKEFYAGDAFAILYKHERACVTLIQKEDLLRSAVIHQGMILQTAGGIVQMFPGETQPWALCFYFPVKEPGLTRSQLNSSMIWDSNLGQSNFQVHWARISPTVTMIDHTAVSLVPHDLELAHCCVLTYLVLNWTEQIVVSFTHMHADLYRAHCYVLIHLHVDLECATAVSLREVTAVSLHICMQTWSEHSAMSVHICMLTGSELTAVSIHMYMMTWYEHTYVSLNMSILTWNEHTGLSLYMYMLNWSDRSFRW